MRARPREKKKSSKRSTARVALRPFHRKTILKRKKRCLTLQKTIEGRSRYDCDQIKFRLTVDWYHSSGRMFIQFNSIQRRWYFKKTECVCVCLFAEVPALFVIRGEQSTVFTLIDKDLLWLRTLRSDHDSCGESFIIIISALFYCFMWLQCIVIRCWLLDVWWTSDWVSS